MTKKSSKSKPLINKQALWLHATHRKLVEIDNPESADVITHDSYKYTSKTIKNHGAIPHITFLPRGKSDQIKAEIMRNAGLEDPEDLKQKKAKIREKTGIKKAKPEKNKNTRQLARLFNKYWNAYWISINRSLNRIKQAQQLFITKPNSDETISIPFQILGVTPKAKKEEINKKKSKNYMDELMEVE